MSNSAKRIFSYDYNVAKKTKNLPHYKRMLLEVGVIAAYLLLIVILLILSIFVDVKSITTDTYIFQAFVAIVCFVGIAFIFDIVTSLPKINRSLTVCLIGEDNKVYQITSPATNGYYNDLEIQYKDTGFNDKVLDKLKSFNFLGMSTQYISSKRLNDANTVNYLLNNSETIMNGNMYRIDKVYSIIDHGKYYLVKADIFDYRNNKESKNDEIYIYKVYNCYDELIQYLGELK